MTILTLEPKPNESIRLNDAALAYNGNFPEYDLLLTGIWHAAGSEFLNEDYKVLSPGGVDPLDGDLGTYIAPLEEALPNRGVWDVVALGKLDSAKYWTDCGYEYDMWVDWTIISANKFPSFGELKHWFKKWAENSR